MNSQFKISLEEKTIRKLVDYILLNAYSVNLSGLYNGKAGMALALFETAKYLQDEYIEEQGFELLQEALLSKNEDIGFENGLSGIGFALVYLIKNEFVDGDFSELFGENLEKITSKLIDLEKNPLEEHIIYQFNVVYFLSSVGECKYHEKVIHFIRFFLEKTSILLEKYISNLEKAHNEYLKGRFFSFFETYLRIATYCSSFFTPTLPVLEGYTSLYKKNKLINSFQIGHYLEGYATKWNNNELREIAEINILFACKSLHPETLTLSQRINLLCLLRQHEDRYIQQINVLENNFLNSINEKLLEKKLLQLIPSSSIIAGYQLGITRFLLYWIYHNLDKVTRKRIPFL